MTSRRTATHFFIAIRIRVNIVWELAVFGHCIRTALAAF
jgi:hypothetical protein